MGTRNNQNQVTAFNEHHFKSLKNSFKKINSLMYNLIKEGRINALELEDYNEAASKFFNCLQEISSRFTLMEKELEGSLNREIECSLKPEKYLLLLKLTGMKSEGIDELMVLPKEFLKNISRKQNDKPAFVKGDIYFEQVMQQYRCACLMIDRDRDNIEAIKLYKRLYNINNGAVKLLVKNILVQISEESGHLANDIKRGKSMKQLLKKSENYWYGNV